MIEQKKLDAILRTDLKAFVQKVFITLHPDRQFHDNWHLDAICHELTQVALGESRRLVVNQPPRTLKSITASVAFAAWLIGRNPELLVACVSYSDDLAGSLADQFRRVVGSDWYKRAFPAVRIRQNTAEKVTTTRGGGRIALSVNGSFTGRGADLIIIDDPLNANDANSVNARNRNRDWYSNTLVSRLNDPATGAIVLVMQRLHEDDLSGHLLRTEPDNWRKLILPAINGDEDRPIQIGRHRVKNWEAGELLHPGRLDRDTLESRRKTSGSAVFQAQYLQQPVPAEGAMIKRDWFETYQEAPDPGKYPMIVQSWDIASTTGEHSNWSVCTTWLIKQTKYYLLHVWRGKIEYPDLRKRIATLAKDHSAMVILVENAGIGKTVLQDFSRAPATGVPALIGRTPKGSKADRMAVQSARIEAGQVLLPKDAPWLADYLGELLSFREGATQDDQVDSTSQFLDWATWRESVNGFEDGYNGGTPLVQFYHDKPYD